jgi:hypothetical protein
VNILDHLQAIESRASERYLLGELSAAENEAFELHYFECSECALAVESGDQFIANVRAVLEPERESERLLLRHPADKPRSWFRELLATWMRPGAIAIPAAILFAAVALYQGAVVIPGLRHTLYGARALPAFQLVGASRGEPTLITVSTGDAFFALSLDVPPESHFGEYVCDLSEGGRSLFRALSPAPAEGRPITIQFPVRGLKPGSYELTIFGAGPMGQRADKVTAAPFVLHIDK